MTCHLPIKMPEVRSAPPEGWAVTEEGGEGCAQGTGRNSCFNSVKTQIRAGLWECWLLVHALDTHLLSALPWCLRPFCPYQEGAGPAGRKESTGPRPGREGKSSGGGPTTSKQPDKLQDAAAEGWGGHPPGQGVGSASSKKGEREPVVRCVAGGQGAQEGWLGIRWYPAYPREVGSRPGWVLGVLWDSCSRRQGGQRNPAGCAVALGKVAD